MIPRIFAVVAMLFGIWSGSGMVQAEEAHATAAQNYVKANVLSWLGDKVVVDAIKAANTKNAALTQADIDKLDKEWRGQIDAASKPLIDGIMKNELSAFLAKKKADSKGLITELFVMDNKGLNVGQSDITSDYWQGDEDKWQKTFKVGPDAVFVDDVKKDESTQQLQVQISVPIKDPASGEVIGAITIGLNMDELSAS